MKKLLFAMSIIAMAATGIDANTVSGTVYNPFSTIVHFNYTSGGMPIKLDIAPNSTTEILNMDAQSPLSMSIDPATVTGTIHNPLSTIVHFNYTSGGKQIKLDIAPNSTTENLSIDINGRLSINAAPSQTATSTGGGYVSPTLSAADAGAQGFIITKDMRITFYTPSK